MIYFRPTWMPLLRPSSAVSTAQLMTQVLTYKQNAEREAMPFLQLTLVL